MEKKVTSYRLSLMTLQRLEELQEYHNQNYDLQAESLGMIPGRKFTKAEIIELLIGQEYGRILHKKESRRDEE